MHLTLSRLRMVSTQGGMRNLLKRHGPVPTYIRQAVETGVYRTAEEIETVEALDELETEDYATIMTRFRQDIVRGSNIEDYPAEYLILQQHPPLPDNPRTPLSMIRKMESEPNPTGQLVRKYLDKYETPKMRTNGPKTTEDYYRRLLGVPSPNKTTALGQKSALVQKAYAAAIKNYELQRTQGISEAEAMEQVDALLAQQDKNERQVSRMRAWEVQDFRRETYGIYGSILDIGEAAQEDEDAEDALNYLESIFNASPRTVEGMMRWSERQASIPYLQWTVGASTALDHWIARQLLGLSEETWQALLEGDDPNLLSRGRDIVAVREAVFPETIIDRMSSDDFEHEDNETGGGDDDANDEDESIEKRIEKLLSTLGGSNTETGAEWDLKDESNVNRDAELETMVVELQNWRRKNLETPFKDWSESDQDEFNSWLQRFVPVLTSASDREKVDFEATRDALLAQPPIDEEDSDYFWYRIKDEAEAELLLEVIMELGPPPGASILHAAFWDLPREIQVERLANLGAVRPLMDEYTKESDRLRFLQRYGDALLSGVMLEHLVSDPDGPVTAEQLGRLASRLGISGDERFRLEVLPYNAAGDLSAQEKSRALFKAWNFQKAGRARYEEKLFIDGKLGLVYSDDMLADLTERRSAENTDTPAPAVDGVFGEDGFVDDWGGVGRDDYGFDDRPYYSDDDDEHDD